ncbi:OmpW family outer membrane protein [Paraburkholderia sp. MM5384-R2]|uniref:OmpW/AlkL family protein n=1 Tax=Paraburkholderia sp. MM5384-R2 TaxID=2723097 RepID=UPI00161B9161|nr:OmpW family outer membrane protein [Paraburkholderia sp. MM5384-R2]MBB5498701.1 outer membrane protein [Paraburkholderia sp. MM5384-R2]
MNKVLKEVTPAIVALASLAFVQVAHAQGTADYDRWWIRTGPAWVAFDEKAELSVAGSTVPGAGADVKDNAAFITEFGYRFTPHISLGLTLGIPATTTLTANGTAASVGKIGKVKYGPAGLTLQYQFDGIGGFHPYVGAGVTYLKVFSSSGEAVQNFDVHQAWGGIAQIGTEYSLSKNIGLFIDLKKLILRTNATGTLGGAPVQAHVRLDPLVVQTGVMIRF